MKLVILEGYTLNPGDLSWEGFAPFAEVICHDRCEQSEVIGIIGDADFVLVNKLKITKEVMDSAVNLKYIGVLATGYDCVDVGYAKEKGIVVTNIPSYGTDSVAQMCFALILELYNQVARHGEAVQAGEWKEVKDFCFYKSPLIELAGKTIGIVGFGRIGKAVAKVASGFSMNVLAYDVYEDKQYKLENFSYTSLETLFEKSDIVSLHCNLTADNYKFVNAPLLAKMKKNAIVINTSRGALIDDVALANAVKNRDIFGAGIDVLEFEPMRADNPLLGIENLIVTPHISWATYEARKRLMGMAVDNLKCFVEGKAINDVTAKK